MAGFAARWLSDSLRLGLGLAAALAAMQVPAVTQAYDAALVQLSGEARRDIEERKAVARQYYALPGTGDAEVVEALRTREPANAQGFEASLAREGALRAAHARIASQPALLRPIVAGLDALEDPLGNKRAILRTALALHEPQVLLGTAAATYGLVGLVLGLLLANLTIALAGGLLGSGRRRTA